MNEELKTYIDRELAKGVPKETIIQNLKAEGGWSEEEIGEVFKNKSASTISKLQGALLLILYTVFSLFTAYKFIFSWFLKITNFRSPQLTILYVFLAIMFVVFNLFYISQVRVFIKNKYQDLVVMTTFPMMIITVAYSYINLMVLLTIPIFIGIFLFLKKHSVLLNVLFILEIILMTIFLFTLFFTKVSYYPFKQSGDHVPIPCLGGTVLKNGICQ